MSRYSTTLMAGVASVTFRRTAHITASFSFNLSGDGTNKTALVNLSQQIEGTLFRTFTQEELDNLSYTFADPSGNLQTVYAEGGGMFTLEFSVAVPTTTITVTVTT
jgi:hypothetical protein